MSPALLLLPNLLGELPQHQFFLPASVDQAVESIDGLIAESEKAGRRYLGRFQTKRPAREIPIALLNKNTPDEDCDFLLEPIRKGERWGLVSDAGLPCIADPGYLLVRRARQLGISIQTFTGPSAFVMALILSGLPGQSFSFHGYVPKEPGDREKKVKEFENNSIRTNATQIFMDAPHRNQHTLETLLNTLQDSTLLCAAWDLTLPSQGIVTQPIRSWKKMPLPNLAKKNVVFLLHGNV
ncbi:MULTISPECIES: SAM-dependent methyltransferase [Parachlamydia]|jgi:16S rRNA (cytidine1402-2'-O)-methyltransferase|uniref:Ribosomal RNA smaLL subunit methyltransferase I n=2 Tax=Parachlamydia acanthamoebae TaxID=83552 RepID=F8KWW9_PARAV|nr:SAM-dependent methyltransferase [Parachlamydia acanthamoebae]EFB42792.1 hypothetical protein pah_c002o036 [Parachlamydia acanthamoebae str. Hall's coccus]CCB86588.1 ribosomal RNA smaLL subunit methyltransferase I [Parachlamydia acanthamoebae UV-7]